MSPSRTRCSSLQTRPAGVIPVLLLGVHSRQCEGSSVPPATSRTGGSTAARSTQLFGRAAGKGTRSVASYDEDTTTMGVEAARLALRSRRAARTDGAVVRHRRARVPRQDQRHHDPRGAAARLRRARARLGRRGPLRRRRAADRASTARGSTLVVTSDQRDGLPTSADEAARRRRRRRPARRRRRRRPRDRRARRLARAPPRSSSTAGARRATRRSKCVGGALRRDQVRARSANRRGTRALKSRRALRRPGRRSVIVTGLARPGGAVADRARLGVDEGGDRRRPRGDGRLHRRRARRAAARQRARAGGSPAR